MARIFTDAGGQALASASQLLLNPDNFSVSFWIFRTATPAVNADLIGPGNGAGSGWTAALFTTNLIQAEFKSNNVVKARVSATAPALNTWVHVVITHVNRGTANTDFLFYFNGKQEAGTAVSTMTGTHLTAATAFIIGHNAAEWARAAPARIGPVAVWNRELSPAEALALAGGASPLRFREGLVEMFDMEGDGVEEGWLGKISLVPGTDPAPAVGPAVERPPVTLDTRQNMRPRVRMRARYISLGTGTVLAAGLGSLIITGLAAQINIGAQAGLGAMNITGQAAQVAVGLLPGVGALSITGQAARANIGLQAGLGALTVAGQAARADIGLRAGLGQTVITGQPAQVNLGLQAGFGQTVITGFAPTAGIGLRAGLGSTIITGLAATANVAGGGITLVAGLGDIRIDGLAATAIIPTRLQADIGALVIMGYAASIHIGGFEAVLSSPIVGVAQTGSPIITAGTPSSVINGIEQDGSGIATTLITGSPTVYQEES